MIKWTYWSSCVLGQLDELFPALCGFCCRLLCLPDGSHLGDVSNVLVLNLLEHVEPEKSVDIDKIHNYLRHF